MTVTLQKSHKSHQSIQGKIMNICEKINISYFITIIFKTDLKHLLTSIFRNGIYPLALGGHARNANGKRINDAHERPSAMADFNPRNLWASILKVALYISWFSAIFAISRSRSTVLPSKSG